MGNVWEAMRKHEAEQEQAAAEEAETKASAPAPADAPAKAETAAPMTPINAPAPSAKYAAALVAHHDRGGRITEQYRALRTHLLAQSADGRFCMMVTSAERSEGKTVSALNLALVMAERQERTSIVVDADLRMGKIARHLRGSAEPGMSDLLRGRAAMKDVIQPTVYPNLFFVTSGQARGAEVGELIHRPELNEIVSELRRDYDYVLLDTPPVNEVSDAGMIGGTVGEALLVVRMNKTPRERVDRAIRLLRAANTKVNGIVLTYHPGEGRRYRYKYH